MVDVIHVHEDDWGMRNLYPLTVREEVEEDVANAAAAAEQNRDPSGFGFTNMYMAKQPSADYTEVGLTLEAAELALAPLLPRVRGFHATIGSAMGSEERDPYGSYEDDAWCFGLGPDCYLKLDAKGSLVGNIWFDLSTEETVAVDRLRNAIEAINALAPSVIADYLLDFAGPVSDTGVLDRYFAGLADQRRHAEQAMLEYRARHEQKAPKPGIVRKLFTLFGGNG
ncbi:hypothetical protein [Sphingomonas sp. NFX23]|uniref:hypothetical protein n=1 Tax=Sphingomonas sp. NFX23 TaxID=2819532 RepID=UPI003CF49678